MLQAAVIDMLSQHFQRHPAVLAGWLKGSQARGDADTFSDIDLHLLIEPEGIAAFQGGLRQELSKLFPVLRYHELFGGAMVGVLLETGFEEVTSVDFFLETTPPELLEQHHRLLWDRTVGLSLQAAPATPPDLREEARIAIEYFWALYRTAPLVRRGELIASMTYFAEQLAIVCGLARGVPCRVGRGRLNSLMTLEDRAELERLLALPDTSETAILTTLRGLGKMMQVRGREASRFLGMSYPAALEEAVLKDTEGKLGEAPFTGHADAGHNDTR